MLVGPLLLFGTALLAWVLMALARIRPSWPVALVTADGLPNAWRVALGSPVVVLFAWGVVRPILR